MRLATAGLVLVALATATGGMESPDERLEAAAALLRQGDQNSAERILRAVYKETQSARSAYSLAVVCVLTSRLEEAERLLKQALSQEPEHRLAWKTLGLLYQEQFRYGDAVSAFRSLVDVESADQQAWLLLGKALASSGKHEEAKQVLEALVSGDAGQSDTARESGVELGLLYVKKAHDLFEEGSFEAAAHELEAARELLPPSPELHEFLGHVYWKTDNTAALHHLLIAAEGIASEAAWDAYARALAEFGMLDEAVRFFRSKVEQEPTNSFFRILLGAALWDMTDYERALEQYHVAAKQAPDNAKAHFLKGTAHRLLGQDVEAKTSFKRCLQIDAEFEPALFALGKLLAAEGQWADAALQLERVRDGDSKFQPVRLELGKVYRRQGRLGDALRELVTAQRLRPEDKKVYYLLGKVYSDLSQHSQAQKAFARFALIEETELQAQGKARPYLSPGLDAATSPPKAPPLPAEVQN